MGPSTDRVTTSCVPWYFAACSIIRWQSKGQSCINPSIRTSLRWFVYCRTIRRLYGRIGGLVHGIDMNSTAQNASRKWANGAFRRIEPAMVTVAAVALALLLGMPTEPAMAAKAFRPAPWADLFRDISPRERRAPRATVRRAAVPVPLPKPRPADAPSAERDKPDKEQQASPPN